LCDYAWAGVTPGPPPADPSPPTGYPTFVSEFNGLLGYTPPMWTAAPSVPPSFPQSYILTPVIVSAGPDRQMALDPTQGLLAATPPDPAYDNIYSTQLQ
jgi:hypothetical protein